MPILPFIDYVPSNNSNYNVNKFTLGNADVANKYVTLSSTPTTASKTVLEIIGGDGQAYGVDFTIMGNQLNWSGLGLDGVLVSGDNLVVQFN